MRSHRTLIAPALVVFSFACRIPATISAIALLGDDSTPHRRDTSSETYVDLVRGYSSGRNKSVGGRKAQKCRKKCNRRKSCCTGEICQNERCTVIPLVLARVSASSGNPTESPSIRPSVRPRSAPSKPPSSTPSLDPISKQSNNPTKSPSTLTPSASPSVLPTGLPSESPSLPPSSKGPSDAPSLIPSSLPSTLPSARPTASPIARPNPSPSGLPSAGPSNIPRKSPGHSPFAGPSHSPSTSHTTKPTSLKPSISATVLPGDGPSPIPSTKPSHAPNPLPSSMPSMDPSKRPSWSPSENPIFRPSPIPSISPSTLVPSEDPTMTPSMRPQNPRSPSTVPSVLPSISPSVDPSRTQSVSPSANPSVSPFVKTNLTFYAVGDVPYSNINTVQMEGLLETMSNDAASNGAEFLIHLGDIKRGPSACTEDVYEEVANIFNKSSLPCFFVLGDNEWIDCVDPNSATGLGYWNKHLLRFDEKYWNHGFNVKHQDVRDENFSFFLGGVLVVGVNLVSAPRKVKGEVLRGPFNEGTAWEDRLDDNIIFTQGMFAQYEDLMSAVVIFGHAANSINNRYLNEIAALADMIHPRPILFMQGNRHSWAMDFGWKKPNILRVTVDSDSKNAVPPVQVVVDPTKTTLSEAFTFSA